MQRHIDFSPSSSTIKKLCCSPTYGSSRTRMSQIMLIFAFLAMLEFVSAEYPENFHASGRRRQMSSVSADDEKQDLIERLTNYIDQQARRKFQQQLHQKHQQQMQLVPQEITGPGFSFELPPITKINAELSENNEPIQFAVQPFDSRYYEQSLPQVDEEIAIDETPLEPEIITTIKTNVVEGIGRNKILIPSPMHVLDSSQTSGETQSRILHRAQQKQQQQLLKQSASDVSQKPLQMEFDNSNMNLYLVALIAGISCAFSTGLIALGLMYWTLKKKVKSADACDYASCDYGIVGPRLTRNDPQVAAGDKKLAHSAQMFHYQHQKNQIIAMENRNGAEISHNDDQDNDSDENENDFTVYECPGLAGVGQNMEVKNPLFSDNCETPATTKNEKSQPTCKIFAE